MNAPSPAMMLLRMLARAAGSVALAVAPAGAASPETRRPAPTHADVSYGPHERNVLDLWLAFHDDIADPASADPVLRESSRIVAAGVINSQATLNRHRWPALIGPRDPSWWRKGEDDTFYGMPPKGDLNSPRFQAILRDIDTIAHITKDDPPVFLHTHNHADGPPQNRNHYVHHPNHPRAVKEACDAAGVPAVLSFEQAEPKLEGDYHVALFEFFLRHLRHLRPGTPGRG